MVSDQILPALPKINSKEPAVLMAILGIYKLAYESDKFGITREQCAKSVLPFLISSCVETSLNVQQFEQFVTFTHILMDKVEREQRKRLEQLSATQQQRTTATDFSEMLNANGKMPDPSSLASAVNDFSLVFDPIADPIVSKGPSVAVTATVNSWSPSGRGQLSTPCAGLDLMEVKEEGENDMSGFEIFLNKPSSSSNEASAPSGTIHTASYPLFPQPPKAASSVVQRAGSKTAASTFGDLSSIFDSQTPPVGLVSSVTTSNNTPASVHRPTSDLSAFDSLISFPQRAAAPSMGPAQHTNMASIHSLDTLANASFTHQQTQRAVVEDKKKHEDPLFGLLT